MEVGIIELILSLVLLLVIVIFGIFVKSLLTSKNILDNQCNLIQRDLNLAREKLAENRAKLLLQDEYKEEIIELREINLDLNNRLTSIETREQALLEKEQTMRVEFDHIARRVLEESTKKLSESSSIKLQDILTPFKDRLNEFHKKVDDVYVKEEKERYSLKSEIEKLAKTHENLYSQAENLAKALKGDNKTQGNWGEIQLLKILEDSGLQPNQDYIVQAKGLGLESETGGRQQPDVIVNLPEDKHIIIDAKVNLVSYERYINAEERSEKKEHLKQFITSVKEQIKNLSSKGYQINDKLSTPDFVLMFMPIESAYTVAILEDASLHNYAWEKKIILSSPSVLFAMLKTIAYGISNHKKNKNIEDIVKRSGDMYDKFVSFLGDMEEIGKTLNKTQDSYNSAISRLSSGKGNLISRAENMKRMGLTTKKSVPENFLNNQLEETKED